MKALNVALEMDKFRSREEMKYAVTLELNQRIEVLERIIELNAQLVESPMTYNVVVGLMEQLKTYAPAIFLTAQDSLQKQFDEMLEQHGKRNKPLYGEE